MRSAVFVSAVSFLIISLVRADGPSDNLPDQVRRIPPPGIKISEADRAELAAGVADLGKEIESLRGDLKGKPALLDLLPDVEIYHKAVDWALRYDEFYKSHEVQFARAMLILGQDRAKSLREGVAPDRKSTRLNSSHTVISYAVFCLKKKKKKRS